jgi:hypothetical protein
MASGFRAIGAVDAGAYEIDTSGGEAGPGRLCGTAAAATGAAWEIGNWVIGTSRGSGACAAMSIRTRRGDDSAASIAAGSNPDDTAIAVATRQIAIRRVRILFPMASLSVARGLIRAS